MAISNVPRQAPRIDEDFNFTRIDTRLAAINLCLSVLGRAGVSSSDSTNVDAQMASREIDRVAYKIQNKGGEGWWFNRENNWKLNTDINGFIYIPNNVLSLLATRINNRPVRGFTIRADKLYDTNNHTFDLSEALKGQELLADLVIQLPYEHLPPSAKMYIAYRAALNFSGSQEFDMNRLSLVERNVSESLIDMQSEEASQHNNNYWEQNQVAKDFAMNVGGGSIFSFLR